MDDRAVVAYLLAECNADPNCTAYNGSTPTSLAESSEVVKLLLEHGGVTNNSTKRFLAAQETVPRVLTTRDTASKVPSVPGFSTRDKSDLITALRTEVKQQVNGWPSKKYKETSV